MRVDVQLDQVRLLQSLSNLNKPRFYAASRVSLEAVFLYSFFIDYHDWNMYYDGRRKLLEKHTHKNALFACESESAMGGGERGGL